MTRVCLLTGASGTLGRAFCRLAGGRYSVVGVYRSHVPGVASQFMTYFDPAQPRADLPENQHPIFAVQGDLSDPADVRRIVEVTLARFGRIDVIVNAAAIYLPTEFDRPDEFSASLVRHFDVNVVSPMRLALTVAELFWKRSTADNLRYRRHIVNVSSTSALDVYPHLAQGCYAAAKSALNHLTLHLACEFRAMGIRANAVAPNSFPGIVPTEQVVQAILDLDAGTANGEIVRLDGAAGDATAEAVALVPVAE